MNGGSCVQIATNQPDLFVVYDGKVTRAPLLSWLALISLRLGPAYDLKLLIDKGIHDIVKPGWVKESVGLGELVPLRKKLFPFVTL